MSAFYQPAALSRQGWGAAGPRAVARWMRTRPKPPSPAKVQSAPSTLSVVWLGAASSRCSPQLRGSAGL